MPEPGTVREPGRDHDDRNAASRLELAEAVRKLDPDDLAREVEGGWTVGALLAHLAFWDRLVAARWSAALRSGAPTPIGLDEALTELLNEASLASWRAIDRALVGDVLRAAAEEVDELVAGLPSDAVEAIGREGRPRLLDRSLHRAEHLAMVRTALGR